MNGEFIFNNLLEISSQPHASSDLSDFIIFSISKVVVNFLLHFCQLSYVFVTRIVTDYYYCSNWIVSVLCVSVITDVNVISYRQKIAIKGVTNVLLVIDNSAVNIEGFNCCISCFSTCFQIYYLLCCLHFDVEYIYGFVMLGGL